MADHRLNVLAAAALSLGIAGEAAAGGCCPGLYGEVLVVPPGAGEMYLVNQGPGFSGPGHSLPRHLPDAAPDGYPSVGYVFTAHPPPLHTPPHHPRPFSTPHPPYP